MFVKFLFIDSLNIYEAHSMCQTSSTCWIQQVSCGLCLPEAFMKYTLSLVSLLRNTDSEGLLWIQNIFLNTTNDSDKHHVLRAHFVYLYLTGEVDLFSRNIIIKIRSNMVSNGWKRILNKK